MATGRGRPILVLAAAAAALVPAAACRGREAPREASREVIMEKKVLDSPVAGSWYSADASTLRRELQGYLDGATLPSGAASARRVAGIISPHAGYRYSGPAAAHGYRLLQGKKVRRVIVVGPSHRVAFSGLALPDATHWRTPLGEAALDVEAIRALAEKPPFQVLPRAFAQEHSVDIQIPFLQIVAPDAVLVPVLAGELSAAQVEEAGRRLRDLVDEGTVIVASSDFTHYGANYGYRPFPADQAPERLQVLADEAIAAIVRRDAAGFRAHLGRTGDTICGAGPIQVLLAALPGRAEAVRLAFDTSGRRTGDFENSVTYVSMGFILPQGPASFQGVKFLERGDEKFLLRLARETLRAHLAGRPLPVPSGSESVRKPYGVFVTLKKAGDLRGCIGSIVGNEPLVDGVIRNAVNAAAHDPRFRPVDAAEEREIDLEISVLSPLKEVAGADDIVLGRDGILLSRGSSRAVFLPQVAPEQGWDLETTLSHLSQKAGLRSDAWKQGAKFETFQAQVFGEKDE